MANNYLQFSEVLPHLTDEEVEWLRTKLWTHCDPCLDEEDEYSFSWLFDTDKEWGKHLWIYSEEYGDPNDVAKIVQAYLRKFHPDKCWGIEWAYTCSKPRVGEFGGGYMLVSANEIYGPLGLLETADDEHLSKPINR